MGLGHQLWWPVYLKRNGARFWAAYLDRFGVPTTKAVYPSDESEAENEKRKKDALAAALSLRSEGAVALPEGFDVSLVESTSRGSGDFKDFLAYWDDAIAKIILSQTGTSRIASTAARPRSTAASAPAWSRLTRICCASLSMSARLAG